MKCKMHDVKSSVEKCMLIRFEIVAEINTEHKKEGETPVFITYASCIWPHNRYAQAL